MTGDGSIRDVEEFMVHPNVFKNDLGRGEAILILPHEKGSKSVRIKFGIRKNLKPIEIPEIYKLKPELLKIDAESDSSKKNSKVETGYDQAITTQAAIIDLTNNNQPKEAC